ASTGSIEPRIGQALALQLTASALRRTVPTFASVFPPSSPPERVQDDRRPGAAGAPPRLVRHPHRVGHVAQHMPAGTAEYELAKPCVPVAAHDKQVGAHLPGASKQRLADAAAR